MHTNRRARLGAAAIVLLLLVSATSIVLAQESVLDGKLRTGETVMVPANESVDGDLYLVGGTVTMDGNVDGDLTVVGGQVTVNGTVTGDVLAAGGMISIGGTIEGDLRQAGGQTTLGGDVGEDVLAAGGRRAAAATGAAGGPRAAAASGSPCDTADRRSSQPVRSRQNSLSRSYDDAGMSRHTWSTSEECPPGQVVGRGRFAPACGTKQNVNPPGDCSTT